MAYKLDDAGGGEELARLVLAGYAQVGIDEFLLDGEFLELAVMQGQLGIVGLVEPVAETRLPVRRCPRRGSRG